MQNPASIKIDFKKEIEGFWETSKIKILKTFEISLPLLACYLLGFLFPWFSTPLFTPNINIPRWIINLSMTPLDLIHILGIFIIFFIVALNIRQITKFKNLGQSEDHLKPQELIQEGPYAHARHPMYGMFMLNIIAILSLLGNILGLFLMILLLIMQSVNGIFEEQKELIPIFGEQYNNYTQSVTTRYLTSPWKEIAIFMIFFAIYDVFFFYLL